MAKVVIIGPGYPLRGGLATFNQRLSKEFSDLGDDCVIYSFSLQYPKILFPGKTQFSSEQAPDNIKIVSAINSVNPLNWIRIGNRLKMLKPDLIVVRFWIPFMGPALGTILRRVRKNNHTRIVCIADNVRPHEKRIGDTAFTKYFLKSCHAFITMSEKVMKDLRQFVPNKPAQQVQHPLYDNFGNILDKTEARRKIDLPLNEKLILFFGFIRNYKGLDILLEAMSDQRIKDNKIKLIVAGEFYEDPALYHQLMLKYGLEHSVILRTDFIPDSQVQYYLSAADAVIQPYRNATQSGVTPLAYHFEKPMVVTNVGGLPDLVPHEQAGIVTEPNPTAIADAILRVYELGEHYFIPHLRTEKKKYAWHHLVSAIKKLAAQ